MFTIRKKALQMLLFMTGKSYFKYIYIVFKRYQERLILGPVPFHVLKVGLQCPPKNRLIYFLASSSKKKKDENQAVVNQAVTSKILKLTLFF